MEGSLRLLNYIQKRFGSQGLEIKSIGEHGKAFLLVGDESLVVKAIASEGKWRRYLWASEFLGEHGVKTPPMKLLPESVLEEALYLIFEQHIPGETLSSRRPSSEDLEMVVGSIRRLHSVERRQWGAPVRKMRKNGYFRRHLKKIEGWCQCDPELWMKIQKSKWVDAVVEKLDKKEKSFQLTHGDLHGKNILVTGKEVFFVDLVRSGFGSYAKDLVRLDVWERRTWGTRMMFHTYLRKVEDPLLEDKLKLFFLGELVRRRGVDWIREDLRRLLEREELP